MRPFKFSLRRLTRLLVLPFYRISPRDSCRRENTALYLSAHLLHPDLPGTQSLLSLAPFGTCQISGVAFAECCLSCSPTRVHWFHHRQAFNAAFRVCSEGLLRPQLPQRPRNPRILESTDLLDIRHYALSSSCLTCPLSCFQTYPCFPRVPLL
jgi:hypothetical protein